jgi:2-phospho-L-lactate guanylyltransferase (CobY/MobA/RfbA family)
MTFAEQYRSLAAQFMARARSEQNLKLRSEWDFLAVSYMRLAEQAERNGQTDVVYEPPLTDSDIDSPA